jgi:anti-anti-sigma factor
MSESLEVTNQPADEATTLLRVSGRLDSSNAPALVKHCQAVSESGRNLVLNLEGVTFIASSGVGALLATAEQFRECHLLIRLVALSPAVDSVVRLLNLDRFLPIDAAEADALSALKAA